MELQLQRGNQSRHGELTYPMHLYRRSPYTTDTPSTTDASRQSTTRSNFHLIFVHVPNILNSVNIFWSLAGAVSEPQHQT